MARLTIHSPTLTKLVDVLPDPPVVARTRCGPYRLGEAVYADNRGTAEVVGIALKKTEKPVVGSATRQSSSWRWKKWINQDSGIDATIYQAINKPLNLLRNRTDGREVDGRQWSADRDAERNLPV